MSKIRITCGWRTVAGIMISPGRNFSRNLSLISVKSTTLTAAMQFFLVSLAVYIFPKAPWLILYSTWYPFRSKNSLFWDPNLLFVWSFSSSFPQCLVGSVIGSDSLNCLLILLLLHHQQSQTYRHWIVGRMVYLCDCHLMVINESRMEWPREGRMWQNESEWKRKSALKWSNHFHSVPFHKSVPFVRWERTFQEMKENVPRDERERSKRGFLEMSARRQTDSSTSFLPFITSIFELITTANWSNTCSSSLPFPDTPCYQYSICLNCISLASCVWLETAVRQSVVSTTSHKYLTMRKLRPVSHSQTWPISVQIVPSFQGLHFLMSITIQGILIIIPIKIMILKVKIMILKVKIMNQKVVKI